MKTVIIKYNSGNIQSVQFALERIGIEAVVSDDKEQIQSADKVIFPGVGEASSAMNFLRQRELDKLIIALKQPVLGICLGMQLLCSHSDENQTRCLGVFNNVKVKRFQPTGLHYKAPQIGWNTIYNLQSPLFTNIESNSYCYYVHGYYAELSNYSVATTEYGIPYSAAIQKDNFYGVQFHPEKSAAVGEQILKNFLSL